MIRAAARLIFACFLVAAAAPVASAQQFEIGPTTVAALAEPATLADAPWMHDQQPNGKTLNLLFGSYSVLQGLDMYSTIAARSRGAREVNPLMDTGHTQAAALKAATSVATYFATRAMGRKSKKGAVVMMAVLNGVTGAVVLTNMKNAVR